jgi:hypothetical protein
MELLLKDIAILLASIFTGCFAISFGYGLAMGLRNRVSEMSLSHSGVQIHTNDVQVWSSIGDRIRDIDLNTCKSIRKGTERLKILNPEKHGISAEVMLVNREATQPLTSAAYENHHTRELADGGSDVYIAHKTHEVFGAVRVWQQQFPELTEERSHCFACLWVKKILIPNLRRACIEKVIFYKRQSARKEISKTIRDILIQCLEKNERYIQCIDALSEHSDIKSKSGIFNPTPTP